MKAREECHAFRVFRFLWLGRKEEGEVGAFEHFALYADEVAAGESREGAGDAFPRGAKHGGEFFPGEAEFERVGLRVFAAVFELFAKVVFQPFFDGVEDDAFEPPGGDVVFLREGSEQERGDVGTCFQQGVQGGFRDCEDVAVFHDGGGVGVRRGGEGAGEADEAVGPDFSEEEFAPLFGGGGEAYPAGEDAVEGFRVVAFKEEALADAVPMGVAMRQEQFPELEVFPIVFHAGAAGCPAVR